MIHDVGTMTRLVSELREQDLFQQTIVFFELEQTTYLAKLFLLPTFVRSSQPNLTNLIARPATEVGQRFPC